MKIRSQILKYMHLDRTYCLLTGRCSSSEVNRPVYSCVLSVLAFE